MNYQNRIIHALQHLDLETGTLATVHVQHDNHCPILAGKPYCRCVPIILIDSLAGTIEVMPNGDIRHPANSN
jgi:hypothetical protein